MKKIILIILVILLIAIALVAVYIRQRPKITKEYINQRFLQLRQAYQDKLDQGYDLSEVLSYGKEALEAFNKGDYKLTKELLDKAFDALERAKIPPEPIKQCPICPLPSEWSECKDGKQTRTNYKCSSETDYKCQAYVEERDCKIPSPTKFKFDKEAYKNYLDWNVNQILARQSKSGEEVQMMFFTIYAYKALELEIPRKQEIINYLNSAQKNDGTWPGTCPNNGHWAPATASTLMALDMLGAKPAKSLVPYYERTDTWQEVDSEIRKDKFCGGYWGESWGHAGIYAVDKKSPPWIDEWYAYTNNNSNLWLYDSHQREHLAMAVYHLCLDMPLKQKTIDIMIEDQKPDGSWEYKDTETAGAIAILNLLGASGPEVEQAKQKAIEYLLPLYHEWNQDGKKMAAFSFKGRENHPAHSLLVALTQEGIITGNPNIWNYRVCQ